MSEESTLDLFGDYIYLNNDHNINNNNPNHSEKNQNQLLAHAQENCKTQIIKEGELTGEVQNYSNGEGEMQNLYDLNSLNNIEQDQKSQIKPTLQNNVINSDNLSTRQSTQNSSKTTYSNGEFSKIIDSDEKYDRKLQQQNQGEDQSTYQQFEGQVFKIQSIQENDLYGI